MRFDSCYNTSWKRSRQVHARNWLASGACHGSHGKQCSCHAKTMAFSPFSCCVDGLKKAKPICLPPFCGLATKSKVQELEVEASGQQTHFAPCCLPLAPTPQPPNSPTPQTTKPPHKTSNPTPQAQEPQRLCQHLSTPANREKFVANVRIWT